MRFLGIVVFKTLQVVVAIGLLLSLLIVGVAVLLSLLVALVALSRGDGSSNHRRSLLLHFRTFAYAIREMLWCYAVFGHSGDGQGGNGGDPFLRQVAADVSLACSICFGSPWSVWYWIRMRQHMTHRRPYWSGPEILGRRRVSVNDNDGSERVSSTRRPRRGGAWGARDDDYAHDRVFPSDLGSDDASALSSSSRGLLSVAVEFLFGPTPYTPGPTSTERWKLRAMAILELLTGRPDGGGGSCRGVSLADLAPWADDPPHSLDDSHRVVQQGLQTVAHFHGIPNRTNLASPNDDEVSSPHQEQQQLLGPASQARFDFPELTAEGSIEIAASDFLLFAQNGELANDPTLSWTRLLYSTSDTYEAQHRLMPVPAMSIPAHLREKHYRLTHLTPAQFGRCAALGLLNLLGVVWLGQALKRGGNLYSLVTDTAIGPALVVVWPILMFYAVLFWALPLGRLALILFWNSRLRRRNWRRAALALDLERRAAVEKGSSYDIHDPAALFFAK